MMVDWFKNHEGISTVHILDYLWVNFGQKLLSYILKLFHAFPNVKEEDRILDSCIPDEVTVGSIFFGYFSGRKNSYYNLRGKILGRIL